MGFKLPNGLPNSRSSSQDWADYAEFLAIKDSTISLMKLRKYPMLVSDEIDIDGIEDEADKLNNKMEEVSQEIESRINHLGVKYPFKLENNGYVLRFKKSKNISCLVYKYLLFATRIKMTGKTGENRVLNKLDGSLLFEKLCGEIVAVFFGPNTKVDVFGTSKSDGIGFYKKIDVLIKELGEGIGAKEYKGAKPQDDKVDIIVWKEFLDKKTSKFIGFGQCKTGTSWVDTLSELQPDIFCKTWFIDTPIVTPIKMFFCAQYFPKDKWDFKARQAGLIFDRFRIIENLPVKIDKILISEISSWLNGAEQKYLV